MNCPKCHTKNIIKASFCKKCKYEFTEQEKEKAYQKTIYYPLEKVEEWYYHLTLQTITSHILFKIGSLLLILGIGLYYYFTVGINTALLKSNSYDLYFNKKKHEYYMITKTNQEKLDISLYVPNRAKKVELKHYSKDHQLLEETTYQKKKPFQLTRGEEDYYLLETTYKNKKKESLKIKIYTKEEVESQ